MKLIESSASSGIVVASSPSAGPLLKINIFFFLLSACTEEISTPNIIRLLPNPSPLDNEKVPHTSNPIPYPE